MADLLSPGVQIIEIDASGIAPTVSNSIGVFCGTFTQGPVGTYTLITNTDELESFYGLPTNDNYNEWFQCYNFLQYGNKLLVARAADTNGTDAEVSGITVTAEEAVAQTDIEITGLTAGLTVGDFVTFGTDTDFYEVTAIVADTSFTIERGLESIVAAASTINVFTQAMNATVEAVDVDAVGEAVTDDNEYVNNLMVIENASDFESKEVSIAFTNASDSKLRFIARNPGKWAADLDIAIALPTDFGASKFVFEGLALDELFEYFPTGTEVGVIIKLGNEIVETFTVDFDETAKDSNGKSSYIETVINRQSQYIFVKENTANAGLIKSYVYGIAEADGPTLKLVYGADSATGQDDIISAYELFDNKEELDVDIIIANENYPIAATNLADTRKDCIAFVGSTYTDTVGKKAADATSAVIAWRKSGELNINNMFVCASANYKYIYDRYSDKYRWVNIAGDIAGLRAQTSTNRASWWASAGLERGQIKNITKLAFNPNNGQRDLIYQANLNPVVSFPGQGTVMWGQKTLLDKPSSFDRVNVRGLFNTLERSLGKMAKYKVMEFNDNFTRNSIISMIKPFLSSVKAGRGIEDFLVVCDESNNTNAVIQKNNLVVDIYIKPTYVAEFINLRFTNAGTNSFSEVIGG